MRVYVVDEHLRPVPLGAPGEIVFSGVCVGRGYINDPERTRPAFLTDPHRAGERLYRGGDYGRWLPDGKLEFLGRRDTQVKISGFRIEIGEIENTLLRVPGVARRRGGGRRAARPEQAPGRLLRRRRSRSRSTCCGSGWADRCPHYMVPAAFHWRDKLPLTANGKIDTKALTALAAELEVVDRTGDAPRTPTEQRLAAA